MTAFTKCDLPRPNASLVMTERFEPCLPLWDWVQGTFILPQAELFNPDHEHLVEATIGFLWCGPENHTKGTLRLGDAQLGLCTSGEAWSIGITNQIRSDWFGCVPDFLIRLDAGFFSICTDAEACAVIEHELYHCAQAMDGEGEPAFDLDGNPRWRIRPHDIEEFAGVIERYGAAATHSERIKRAFERGPTISPFAIAGVCGTCARAA